VRVVLTLLVRDEADVVEACLQHHLALGVDHVIATDHRSTDGTTAILERYERDGRLTLLRERGETLEQAAWVTRMARLAATEHAADWVVNCDADEFWWPREGPLHEVLGTVSPRFGAVRGMWRHFVPRPGAGDVFERMVVRRRPSVDLADPFHAQIKVAHRASPDVVVSKGNHDADGTGLRLIREWLPFEVLHVPIRSRDQLERKYRLTAAAEGLRDDPRVARHVRATLDRLAADGAAALYDELVVDDDRLRAGAADGSLVVDTRLRDRARAGWSAALGRPTLEDDADLALDAQIALEHDAAVVLERRLAAAEHRVATLAAQGALVRRAAGRLRGTRWGRREARVPS
jgi:hypothetical protein